jgi:hypothetical protein
LQIYAALNSSFVAVFADREATADGLTPFFVLPEKPVQTEKISVAGRRFNSWFLLPGKPDNFHPLSVKKNKKITSEADSRFCN